MNGLPVSESLEFRVVTIMRAPEQTLSSLPNGYDSLILTVSMRNVSDEPLRLMGRKWIINSANDHTDIVEGDTVFNTHPLLCPGQIFSFTGFHIVRQPAELTLILLGKDNHGANFRTPPLTVNTRTSQSN